MKFSLEFPQCFVCRTAISSAPDTCDICLERVHEWCMGPDHYRDLFNKDTGDIFRYCMECERYYYQ